MPALSDFLHSLILVPLTLLPIMNPLSSAPVFSMTAGPDPDVNHRLARQVAINCWFVIVGSILVGTYVLDLFGISLPIVRVGGGLLVAASGWRMLSRGGDDSEVQAAVQRSQASAMSQVEVVRKSFFPITFPLTTGPGTIAAAIAIGASLPRKPALYALGAVVAMLGALLTVLLIYLLYRHSLLLMAKLGEVGTLVMMRLMAFLLLCIGIQIMWTGWAELNGLPV